MSVALFDLDSTLADTRHRRGLVPIDPRTAADWLPYAIAAGEDAPVPGTIRMARMFASAGHGVYIITARPRTPEIAGITAEWLTRHDVPCDRLFLMPGGLSSVSDWKRGVVTEILRESTVALAVDDWYQNCDMFTELGIPTLHVAAPGTNRDLVGAR